MLYARGIPCGRYLSVAYGLTRCHSFLAGRKPKQRSLAKGAKGGKLRPGEKRQLRNAKIEVCLFFGIQFATSYINLCLESNHHHQAKRASRESGRGFDPEALMEQLLGFVVSCGDMMSLDPAGKHGLVSDVG